MAEEVNTGNAAPAASGLAGRLRRGILIVGLLLVLVYAVLLATAGGSNLLMAVAGMKPELLALPVLATLLSYITMSLSYEGIARAAGAEIRSRDMLRITFIANTANYVLPSGGLSGFAVRLVFFTKKGVNAGRAVAISFTQTLLTNLMLMVFVLYGLVGLIVTRKMVGVPLIAALTVATGLSVFLVLCLAMIYRRNLRARVLDKAASVTERVLDFTGYHGRLERPARHSFQHIDEGMELFANRPRAMLAPSMWIFLDWLFMIGTLYLGFYAVGYTVPFSVVTIAFSVSIALAIASFIPGGAGVLDGALAATFAGLGVAVKDSLLPIFLYRMCYFVLPALLALVLTRGAFADVDPAVAEEAL